MLLPDFHNPVILIISLVTVCSLLILFFYYLYFFSRIAFAGIVEGTQTENFPDISLIICARNEDDNLRLNVPFLCEQDYPKYQVIIVNDCSRDESEQVLEIFEKKYNHLKVVTIPPQEKYERGKKFALTLGIKAADYDSLVLTDADCTPAGNKWLSHMASNFSEKKKIVLGFGAFKKTSGFLNALIRYEGFFTALQYLSYARAGIAYMGVGRNLAYKKELFFANKGFASHQHILSGDDDLFINEVADSNNVKIEIHPDAFTFTDAKTSFGDWRKQKIRHLSTSSFYKPRHRNLLGMYGILQVTFLTGALAMFVAGFPIELPIGLLVIKTAAQYVVFGLSLNRLRQTDLIWMIPILDLTMTIVSPIFVLQSAITKKIKWK